MRLGPIFVGIIAFAILYCLIVISEPKPTVWENHSEITDSTLQETPVIVFNSSGVIVLNTVGTTDTFEIMTVKSQAVPGRYTKQHVVRARNSYPDTAIRPDSNSYGRIGFVQQRARMPKYTLEGRSDTISFVPESDLQGYLDTPEFTLLHDPSIRNLGLAIPEPQPSYREVYFKLLVPETVSRGTYDSRTGGISFRDTVYMNPYTVPGFIKIRGFDDPECLDKDKKPFKKGTVILHIYRDFLTITTQ